MNTLKIKTVVMIFLLGFNSLISTANDKLPSKKDGFTSITQDVQKLLKSSDLVLKQTEKATVKIMINSKNEIVVLSVDTNNEQIDAFVKARLNYKKVSTKSVSEILTIPLRLLAS